MMAASGDESLELTPKNVVNAIAEVVRWRALGIQLDIPEHTLSEIEENYPKCSERRLQMVIEWLEQDTNASWAKLVKALQSPDLKKNMIASQIENKYIHRRGSDMSTCTASISSSAPSSPLSPMSLEHVSPLELPSPNFPPNRTAQFKKANVFWNRSLSSVKGSFSNLCIFVADRLQIDIQDLCSFIIGNQSLPTPRLSAATTREVFDFLTQNNMWDYWNHFLLEEIVDKFGSGDAEMMARVEEHKITLSGHLASVKIAECLANGPFHQRHYKYLRRDVDVLKWKLGDVMDEALDFIDNIWKSLKYLGLPRKDVVLDRIQGGCVLVVWLIRSIKSNEVRENAKSNTALFERYSVLWIKINDEYIYKCESVSSEELRLPLPEGEPEEQEEMQPTELESEEKAMKKTKTVITGLIKSAVKPIKQLGQWIQKKRLDLVGACRDNNVDAVMYILEQEGINVNMRESDKHGWTPIMWACENGNLEIMELLIERGADVNAKAKDNNWTSIIIASQRGHLEIVQLLLDHNADVDAQTNDGSTALIWALYNGHVEISRLLVDRGANVNTEEKNGWTPVIRASNKGLVEMVKLLCDKGAELNHQAERGWTALMAATNHNHKEVVDVLLERGADPNLKMTDTNEPALHVACYRGHSEIATTLLKAESEKNACNKEGLTTLMVATNRGQLETVDALIEGGVDIDQPHEVTGWTALFLAAKAGKLDVFKKLLCHGASTEIQGIKVEDVASYFKRNEILKEVKKIRQLPSVPRPVSVPPLSPDPMESQTNKPEIPAVVESPSDASTDQDKSTSSPEEIKVETLEQTDSTPTHVSTSPEVTIADTDTPCETDTHPSQEEDLQHQEEDVPQEEPHTKEIMDASSPTTPPEEITVKEEEEVKAQPQKASAQDIKENFEQMELFLKAFEQRMWKLASQSSGDNRQQSKRKQIQSVEEITHVYQTAIR